MRPTSLRSERFIPVTPVTLGRQRTTTRSDRLLASITGPEAIGIAIFSALGLLLTVVFNLLVPNFAEVAASLQPYF